MWPRLSPQDIELFEPFRKPAGPAEHPLTAVFFDIGSVLIDLDWDSFFSRQHELNPDAKNFSTDAMMARVRENQLMAKWCTGRLGPFEYIKGMLEAAGHGHEQAHNLALGVSRLSNGVYAPSLVKELSSLIVGPARPRVVRLIQNLRRHGFIVGALSNATPWHETDILRTTSLHELFDVVLFSQDVGSEKPDALIYKSAQSSVQKIYDVRCEKSNQPLRQLHPSQFAFVDDTPVNVRAARTLGWQSSLVCLLKDNLLAAAAQMSENELAQISVNSENLVFADEAAKRVEGLFAMLLSAHKV
jgi:HAD superfamily hydrolase (TIGR01509 family)